MKTCALEKLATIDEARIVLKEEVNRNNYIRCTPLPERFPECDLRKPGIRETVFSERRSSIEERCFNSIKNSDHFGFFLEEVEFIPFMILEKSRNSYMEEN
jgi:hypothetical protein|uniref:Uncharacterized protein n=1 Tax=Fervidicoccus fontis TaxID=683846 RepID=A0A7J3SMI0_9CREN